jgi:hypothetical protein
VQYLSTVLSVLVAEAMHHSGGRLQAAACKTLHDGWERLTSVSYVLAKRVHNHMFMC